MSRKAAAGTGTIRKKTVTCDGKEYSYWEARYTAGYDPGTGRQIQRSISGKTQKEVAQKLKAATASIDNGSYTAPNKITVGQWMDIWSKEYLSNIKPYTLYSYNTQILNHIKPKLGAIKLTTLNAHTIQGFYNSLSEEKHLAPKTVKNIHGVLHKSLQQAVMIGYIRFNPSDACTLPRMERKEIKPLDEVQSKAFIRAIQGHRFETLFTVTLFTGLREGEVLGLTWDCVDFDKGIITVNKQLQQERKNHGQFIFAPLKNDKERMIAPAPFVMELLHSHRKWQEEQQRTLPDVWENSGFVFTNALGHHLNSHTVYNAFKEVAVSIGCPEARFHDLRHSYAVASIRAGDDIKTVQGNLGHATAAFTLDVYGHVTEQMKQQSAGRMESYIKDILKL